MKGLPEGFALDALIESLADGWDLHAETIEYAPVGFGSYHWIATDIRGTRRFVTVDDLDLKPWLGTTRQSVFESLTQAFDGAVALHGAGLEFVVAPIRTNEGESLRRLGGRHTVALFPFVEGRSGRSFEHGTDDERTAAVCLLTQLHLATGAVDSIARSVDLRLP